MTKPQKSHLKTSFSRVYAQKDMVQAYLYLDTKYRTIRPCPGLTLDSSSTSFSSVIIFIDLDKIAFLWMT
jgi:hypothetical protein